MAVVENVTAFEGDGATLPRLSLSPSLELMHNSRVNCPPRLELSTACLEGVWGFSPVALRQGLLPPLVSRFCDGSFTQDERDAAEKLGGLFRNWMACD
jgi:hypothetical protein